MAELDLARSVLAKEEAEFMRSGDAVGEAERRVAEAENALQNVRDAQAAQREGLAGRRQEIAAERENAVLERERTSRDVNPALLARYDRIRRGKAPLATIEGCEACGVLLYAKE
jgi:predicted  nucleic acid-binding Zn-ribbon protein